MSVILNNEKHRESLKSRDSLGIIMNLPRSLLLIIIFFIFLDLPAQVPERRIQLFPVIMYDSDIGFGLGGKCLLKDQLHKAELIDLIIFGSSKGEQWYVAEFSFPDKQVRKKGKFPAGIDIKLEYDKYLKSNYFGIGNNSSDNDEQFPREFSYLELLVGFIPTNDLLLYSGLCYRLTSVYGYRNVNQLLQEDFPGLGENLSSGFLGSVELDKRDKPNDPAKGWRAFFKTLVARKFLGGDVDFARSTLQASFYKRFIIPHNTFAARFRVEQIQGDPPYYEMAVIGGTWTNRGYKADRFVDKVSTLTSVESRFRIYRQLGGVLFLDSGRVYRSSEQISWQDWHTSWGGGLRFSPGDIVVRLDIGFSEEGTRIFFNFGQVF